jgi:hypothetical protein
MSESTDQNLSRLVLESLPVGVYVVDREVRSFLWSMDSQPEGERKETNPGDGQKDVTKKRQACV